MTHQRMVYVVDHDPEMRRSLSVHLAAMGAEAWPFSGGGEFLDILSHLMPAVILLDMDMPDLHGLDVMAELERRGVAWPVVGMCGSEQMGVAVEAMKRGAIDFLAKPIASATLEEALAPAWISLERTLEAAEGRRAAQERLSRLTAREADISLALLSGQANKTVAHALGISVRTVEMHRAHIMAKLGVKSLAEAAVIATQAGLELGSPAWREPQGGRAKTGRGAPGIGAVRWAGGRAA
jgi:two-component system response regulator FixJ